MGRTGSRHVASGLCVKLLACALYACACAAGTFGSEVARGNAGSAVAPSAAAGACEDVSAATMMKKTGGDVPDCTIGKVFKLCARNPLGRQTLIA